MALSFNRRGGVCPPEDINLSICGRIRAGKPCPSGSARPKTSTSLFVDVFGQANPAPTSI